MLNSYVPTCRAHAIPIQHTIYYAPRLHLTQYCVEAFSGYELPGRFLLSHPGAACNLLALHGARSDHTRLDPLLLALQRHGISSLSFDLSGHGEHSPVPLQASSLVQNLVEAKRYAQRAIEQAGGFGNNTAPFHAIFGHSLGGALAMKLAEAHQATIRTLILSAPALYPEAAYAVPAYGPAFTNALAQPFGFLDSTSLAFITGFSGRIILIVGEYDGLCAEQYGGSPGRSVGQVKINGRDIYSPIPATVFDAIRQAAGTKLRVILLSDCDHAVFAHLRTFPAVAETLAHGLCVEMQAKNRIEHTRINTDGQSTALALSELAWVHSLPAP